MITTNRANKTIHFVFLLFTFLFTHFHHWHTISNANNGNNYTHYSPLGEEWGSKVVPWGSLRGQPYLLLQTVFS